MSKHELVLNGASVDYSHPEDIARDAAFHLKAMNGRDWLQNLAEHEPESAQTFAEDVAELWHSSIPRRQYTYYHDVYYPVCT